MTREEAQEYAKTMSYKEAVLNCIHSKGIAYRKASLIKLRELAEIADKLERDNDMTREEAIFYIKELQKTYASMDKKVAEAIDMAIEALQVEAKWAPCSERLPEDSGDYLVCPSDGVIEDYSDCSDVMIMPYDADCEAFGWWTERYDPISLGFVDSDFDEFEVIAWMPLPKPYRDKREVEE